MFLAVTLVLILLTMSFLPMTELRKTEHLRYDTARPGDVPGKDSDQDGIPDKVEKEIGTNPYNPDTDGDGLWDGDEYEYWDARVERGSGGEVGPKGLSVWLMDTFGEEEGLERLGPLGDANNDSVMNIRDMDSDQDGLPDGTETVILTDPADPDSDKDGLEDSKDRNPLLNVDKNGNGIPDDLEDYLKQQSHDLTDDRIDLGNTTDTSDFMDVIFYVEPVTRPRYWRVRAYDTFDGRTWSNMENDLSVYNDEILKPKVSVYTEKEDMTYGIDFDGQVMGYLPTALHTTGVWDIVPGRVIYVDEHGNFLTNSEQVESYRFSALVYNHSLEQLKSGKVSDDLSMENFLQLPDNISSRVEVLAKELGQKGGTPYEKATFIADYLRENYMFNINSQIPGPEENDDIVDWFLFESMEGRSIEFSTVFVTLMRLNGIHSRVADGYAIGEVVDGRRVVRKGHAHTWGEVYLEGPGWLIMESTGTRVSTQGSTGVSATGGDPTVYQGGINGTGGGTTSDEKLEDPVVKSINGTIETTIDKFEVWKGDIFTVEGELHGSDLPPVVDIKVQLKGEDNSTVDSCDGASIDGSFLLLCSPDKAVVGRNKVLITAEGISAGLHFAATNTKDPPTIYIYSNTTFDVDVPDSFSMFESVEMHYSLKDDGGVAYANRTISIEWGDLFFERSTKVPHATFDLLPYDVIGDRILVLHFPGDFNLSETTFVKNITIKNTYAKMTIGVQDNRYVVNVGDSINVLVGLESNNNTKLNEPVSISLDNEVVAEGIANSGPITVEISPSKVEAGERRLKGVYAGSADYPNATASKTLTVIGTTRILISDHTISVGKETVLKPMLVDNLNTPLMGKAITATWTYPSGQSKNMMVMTDETGTAEIPFRTVGEIPGKVDVGFEFRAQAIFSGSNKNITITITSPTVLMAEFPEMLVRGNDFQINGRLFNYKGDGLPSRTIKIYHNGSVEIGATTTMNDGSFLFEAKLLPSAPLGEILFKVEFSGTELLEPKSNASKVPVFAEPRIFIHGPDLADIGYEYEYTVELVDDREQPLANRSVVVNVSNDGKRSITLKTDPSGKAKMKVKASGGMIKMNGTFDGEQYMLPTYTLKIVTVSYWPLVSKVSMMFASIISVILATNYIFKRRQLHDAKDAIDRSRRLKARDRFRKIIFKTYKRTTIKFAEKGVPRMDSQTVREYEVVAKERLPVNPKALDKVTDVFEEARYSDHRMGKRDVKKAMSGFKRIEKDISDEVKGKGAK